MGVDGRQTKALQDLLPSLSDTPDAVRRFSAQYPETESDKQSKLRRSSIVLKEDTALELGGPACGACKLNLYIGDPGQINGDEITVIGPDIPEITETSAAIVQIISASLTTSNPKVVLKLAQYASPPGLLDGCMMRDSGDKIWYRISKDLFAQGFSLKEMGSAILGQLKRDIPEISGASILFVLADSELAAQFTEASLPVRESYQELRKEFWAEKGVDITECSKEHCGACKSHDLCDKVRDIEASYKKR